MKDSEQPIDPWTVMELWAELLEGDQPPLCNKDYGVTEQLFVESLDELYKHLDIVANVIEVRGNLEERPISDFNQRESYGIVHLYGNSIINADGIHKQGRKLAHKFRKILRAVEDLSYEERDTYLPYAKRICGPIIMEGLMVADMMIKRKGI